MSTGSDQTRSDLRLAYSVPRECTLDGFTAEVGASDGFGLGALDALTTVVVTTANSAYRIVALDPPRSRILIQGGRFFPEATEARLAGASFGGSLLKLSWFGRGMRMEIYADGQRIITSPVKSIEVEPDTVLSGPS